MVPRARLGCTAVSVSVLGIGTGTFGFGCQSRQSRQSPAALGALLREASERGVTWWDTSDDYGTHAHVRAALTGVARAAVQISTKTHAATAAALRASLDRALAEVGTHYVDVYFMHDVDEPGELERRRGAFGELLRARGEGLVRAIALSTHNIDTLEACVGMDGLDVVMTNFNRFEDHMDAGLKHYAAALEAHHSAGRGVLVMKAVGEGRLAHMAAESIRWNLTRPFVDAVLVGMDDIAQLEANVAVASTLVGPGAAVLADPANPERIVNVPRVGYMFNPVPSGTP